MYICNLVFGLEILMPGIFLGLKLIFRPVYFFGFAWFAFFCPPSCILRVPPPPGHVTSPVLAISLSCNTVDVTVRGPELDRLLKDFP